MGDNNSCCCSVVLLSEMVVLLGVCTSNIRHRKLNNRIFFGQILHRNLVLFLRLRVDYLGFKNEVKLDT